MTSGPPYVRPAPAVAFFCMPERGHFQRLRSLVAGVARAGLAAHVFTHADFREAVERAGGVFHDLFAAYPLARADDASFPIPCRYVAFAGHYADAICSEVRRLGVGLVIHDSFAVIGRVVAEQLQIPRVNVIAGHHVVPSAFVRMLERDPMVQISSSCRQAVDVLRSTYAMTDASPFCYVASGRPDLNICCEPQEFQGEPPHTEEHALEFFGSLPDELGDDADEPPTVAFPGARTWPQARRQLNVYVSFGTVVWRRYADLATRAVRAIAGAARLRQDISFVVSLGGASLHNTSPEALATDNLRVHDFVNQWDVLRETDVFITHHGMNSTHEAVFHGVPMLSYPFFWDQPAMATTCARLGLSRALTAAPRTELEPSEILAVLDDLAARREGIMAALHRARQWELDVIARRPAVIARIVALTN